MIKNVLIGIGILILFSSAMLLSKIIERINKEEKEELISNWEMYYG